MHGTLPDKNIVLIASAGRTGTMFLGKRLGEVIEDCFSVHEPDIWSLAPRRLFEKERLTALRRFGLWHMVVGRVLGRTGLRAVGKRFLGGEIDALGCVREIRAQRAGYYRAIDTGMIVESYPAWWMFADVINEIFPGAVMVAVVRDPRDWLRSFQRHHPHRRNTTLLSQIMPKPVKPSDIGDRNWAERWDAIGQVGRLAWEWALVSATLQRAAQANPSVRIYRFEDLFAGDGAAMRDLVRFVAESGDRPRRVGDLSGFTSRVENASRGPGEGAAADRWTAAEAAIVDEICGPQMAQYSYGTEPEWRDLIAAGRGAAGRDVTT